MATKGNLLYAQSGGPTAVINTSVWGALQAARSCAAVGDIYAAYHGIQGVLDGELFDLAAEDQLQFAKMPHTPGAVLGSCRYRLQQEATEDYQKILDIFRRRNIRYFLYNGGNDSMDTCNKLHHFFQEQNYECAVIGVPKTIDNDLVLTDHSPGFASSVRCVSTLMAEVTVDACSYTTPQILLFEIMGRNAGWLTAGSALARLSGFGPDLIYLPERTFSLENFLRDVENLQAQKPHIVIAVSESLRLADGRYVKELSGTKEHDVFGHEQMGGAAQLLAAYLKKNLHTKVRAIEFSLVQRAACHLASQVDLYEAYHVAEYAVKLAVSGVSGKMAALQRQSNQPYQVDYKAVDLDAVANAEKKLPSSWINAAGNDVTDEFISYCLPLISNRKDAGRYDVPLELTDNGLPCFAYLKKQLLL